MSDQPAAEASRTARRGLPFGLQFSLAEAFLVALYLCVAVAAAKAGGMLAWLTAEATLVLFFAFVVAAILARGVARAFAIGFVIGAAAHGLFLFYFGASEFNPEEAKLPYSKIVAPVWTALEPEAYVSLSTGKEVPSDEVESIRRSYDSGQTEIRLQTADGSRVQKVERPAREDFMLVAHALGAAAAGYVLGKLAAVLYRRRERTTASAVDAS
ncbi:MAG TPA: hypothetical protein VGN57_14670 [Pirellulaceae bacterium]|jgi:hypothetical protein|nr:hypothetical protein [Pirellulaceae bacterium]